MHSPFCRRGEVCCHQYIGGVKYGVTSILEGWSTLSPVYRRGEVERPSPNQGLIIEPPINWWHCTSLRLYTGDSILHPTYKLVTAYLNPHINWWQHTSPHLQNGESVLQTNPRLMTYLWMMKWCEILSYLVKTTLWKKILVYSNWSYTNKKGYVIKKFMIGSL